MSDESPARAFDDVERGTLHGAPRQVLRWGVIHSLGPLLRWRIEGLEHVPESGAVIVVSNHLANADPLLLAAAFPRALHFMAKKEAFEVPIIPHVIRRVGTFPVDRGKADRRAIRRAEATLAQGVAVGMFPEGTRSATRALSRAYPGAALLALRTGAPVLPVAITGSERLPGNGGKGRRKDGMPEPDPGHPGVLLRFGQPFDLPRELDGRRLRADEATDLMMAEIARLLPPVYRGVYAEAARGDAEEAANRER